MTPSWLSRLLGTDYDRVSLPLSRQALEAALLSNLRPQTPQLMILESIFRAVPKDRFRAMLDLWCWKNPPYQLDKFDCNRFVDAVLVDLARGWARGTKCPEALACGWAWVQEAGHSETHYLLWALDCDRRLTWYEAETRRATSPDLARVFWMGT